VPTGPRQLAAEAKRRARAQQLQLAGDHLTLVNEGLLDTLLSLAGQWEGTVTLPTAPSAETRYRLVIAEYEEYLVDDVARGGGPTSSEGFPEPYVSPPATKDRRLVFVEHVELIELVI
jgi:hypothetical protein